MLTVKNITKSYDNRCVLNIDELVFNKDEVTVILGTSGSGKTTLLNILGTLENPDSGNAYLTNEDKEIDVFSNTKLYRSKEVGFVFQDFNLIDDLSAEKNIKLGGYYAGLNIVDCGKILKRFQIVNGKQNVSTLSGGEKQRVSLCRAITKNANIILADEPSGSLDSENANKFFSALRNLRFGRHIIIVTHDEELAKKYADRIIHLRDGKVVEVSKNNPSYNNDGEEDVNSLTVEPKTKKSSFSAKAAFMLLFNSIKKRLARMISVVIVIAISIAALASVINITSAG